MCFLQGNKDLASLAWFLPVYNGTTQLADRLNACGAALVKFSAAGNGGKAVNCRRARCSAIRASQRSQNGSRAAQVWTPEEAHHVQLWASVRLFVCVCVCDSKHVWEGKHTLVFLFSGATEVDETTDYTAIINITSSYSSTYARRVEATQKGGKKVMWYTSLLSASFSSEFLGNECAMSYFAARSCTVVDFLRTSGWRHSNGN